MKYLALFIFLLLVLVSCKKNEEEEKEKVVPTEDIECDDNLIINDHQVEGYTDKTSYLPGDNVKFKIHSKSDFVDIEIYHYGATTNLIHSATNVKSQSQDYYCRSYSYGCDWETTYEYIIPEGSVSGIYSAHVSNDLNELFYITFVVKGNELSDSEILVMASTNTWQAYNDWSGQSFYRYGLSEETVASTIISFHRPNKAAKPIGDSGHLVGAELHLHRWLENNGYNFDVVADSDLHDDENLLDNYKVVILNVHPEYWTLKMYNQLHYYLEGGGKLMYLGGNGVYWRVALLHDRIEVRKVGSNHTYADGLGGKFRTLGMPESRHLGVQYTNVGINTYAPYLVYNADHWIFEGTGVANGDLIGELSLNNGKASGGETDKMTKNSPNNTVVLGIGTNPDFGGAHMVYYDTPNGSKVFSVGSISYTGSLSVDPIIHQITKNVLDNFLK